MNGSRNVSQGWRGDDSVADAISDAADSDVRFLVHVASPGCLKVSEIAGAWAAVAVLGTAATNRAVLAAVLCE